MNRRLTAVVGAAMLTLSLAACAGSDDEVIINLYGGASLNEFDKVIERCTQEADGRYRIVGNLLPSDADGQREQLVRRLAASDEGMDLLGIDVTWTAEFAEAGWIRPLDSEQAQQATENVLEPTIETARWKDELYAIPWHTNVQLLWYRKSLTPEPPATWDEMFDMADKLEAEGKPHQIGFTGARYEGLVVGFNTILSSLGGTIVNEDSTETTIDDKTVQALEMLQRLASSSHASASLSNAQEPEIFADLQAGRSAFSMNWPYVLSSMRAAGETSPESAEIADDLGFAPVPAVADGQDSRVTLGGRNLAVSSFSKHPQEAFEAAMCFRDEQGQMAVALDSGEPPVLETIYDDPEFQKAYPQYQVMLDSLQTASSRPISPLYQNISTIISETLSPPRSIDPEKTAQTLENQIEQALDGKGILP